MFLIAQDRAIRPVLEPGATVSDDEAEALYRQACAAEGGKHADPVPTKTQMARPGIGIALVLAPWLAGVIGWALYVRWLG